MEGKGNRGRDAKGEKKKKKKDTWYCLGETKKKKGGDQPVSPKLKPWFPWPEGGKGKGRSVYPEKKGGKGKKKGGLCPRHLPSIKKKGVEMTSDGGEKSQV